MSTGLPMLLMWRARVRELHRFVARPGPLLSLPRMVQVWARGPAGR